MLKSLGFSGKTVLERIDSRNYKLRSTLHFKTKDSKYTVTSGLITDGASIPKFLWSFIGCPLSGLYVGSAIIHDGLYKSHAVSQKEADLIFREMLKDNGVGIIKRNLMFFALRLFGFLSYNAKTEEEIEKNKKFVKVQRYKNHKKNLQEKLQEK